MGRNKPEGRPPSTGRIHVAYLVVIAILLIALVVVGAQGVRAARVLGRLKRRYGLAGRPARSSVPRAEALRALDEDELLAPRTFDEYRAEVDGLVERALALREFGDDSRLAGACALSLRGGKRLRPVIILEVCRATTLARRAAGADAAAAPAVDAGDAALFLEFLHTASLVIDDLPAFDDDPLRRGRPATHVAAGPAVAQMAALSLVAAAYQDVCRQVDWIRDHCPGIPNVDAIGTRVCHDVSVAIGALGAAGGQFMDSSLTADELAAAHGPDAVHKIMRLKTATFYEVAFVTGWLIAGGDPGAAAAVKDAGRLFGTAFQIADDVGDMAQDARRRAAGKPGWNYALVHGEAPARAAVAADLASCRTILEGFGLFTPLWEEIYEKVWGMTVPDAGGDADAGSDAAPDAHGTSPADAQNAGDPAQNGHEAAVP
jgi:geranylgeranyl diphosphate synthase type II